MERGGDAGSGGCASSPPSTHHLFISKSLGFILCRTKIVPSLAISIKPWTRGWRFEVDLAAGLADLLERFDEDGDEALLSM